MIWQTLKRLQFRSLIRILNLVVGLVMNIMVMFYIIVWQILSTTSSCSMEEVAAAAPGVRFFQLYVSHRI
jgi:hypothetical protein